MTTQTYELRLTIDEQAEIYKLRTSYQAGNILYELLRDNGTEWSHDEEEMENWEEQHLIVKMNYEIAWAIREHLGNTAVVNKFKNGLFSKFAVFCREVRTGVTK